MGDKKPTAALWWMTIWALSAWVLLTADLLLGPGNDYDYAQALTFAAEMADERDRLLTELEKYKGNQTMDEVTQQITRTLRWMKRDMDFRREQTGLDGDAQSPEMVLAGELLAELEAGNIQCRRTEK